MASHSAVVPRNRPSVDVRLCLRKVISAIHQEWTWQTKSKNALLIDGVGQKAQDKAATGNITRFETGARFVRITGGAGAGYVTGKWSNPSHLTLESTEAAPEFSVFTVLWPERGRPAKLEAQLRDGGTLEIMRPDGTTDFVRVSDTACVIRATMPKPEPSREAKRTSSASNQKDAAFGSSKPPSDEAEVAPTTLPGAQPFIFR
jgi:hypothetical protein